MPFTEAWVEGQPDGAVIPVSMLDDWIRKTKVAVRERLEGDTADTGLIESGSWAAAPKPKLGSARAYAVAAADVGTLPLEDGRLAVTLDTNILYHLKSTGPVPIGGGGGSVAPPLNLTGSVADDVVLTVRNTHANGLGAVFMPGTDGNYGVKVKNAANTKNRWQALGNGTTIMGEPAPHAVAQAADIAQGISMRHYYSDIPGGDAGSEIFISNQSSDNASGLNTQWGRKSHFSWTTFGGWDKGSRFGHNINFGAVGGSKLWESDFGAWFCGFAGDGSWAYSWSPPFLDAANPADRPADTTRAASNSPYQMAAGDAPYYAGQVLILDGGAYWMRKASIMAQRKAWDFQLGVTPARETDLPGIVTINMLAAVGLTDRVQLYVDGALRTVHAFNDGAGHMVLYY